MLVLIGKFVFLVNVFMVILVRCGIFFFEVFRCFLRKVDVFNVFFGLVILNVDLCLFCFFDVVKVILWGLKNFYGNFLLF